MLMTAVFLMFLAETLSEMCSAQGEQSGQPNHMGSGQNRCAASIHRLAPALALVKREDRTGGMWKCTKEQERLDKWDPAFPPAWGEDVSSEIEAALAGMMLTSASSMTPNATPVSEVLQPLPELKSNREKTRSKTATKPDGEEQFIPPPCAGQFRTKALERLLRPTNTLCL